MRRKKFLSTTTAPVQAGDCSVVRPEFGRVPDVKRLYGLSRATIYNLLSAGKIKGVCLRVSGSKSGIRLIDLGSVDSFIRGQMNAVSNG